MPKPHALAFARSPAVILFESGNDNMWNDWVDCIAATRTKARVFAVYARKFADEHVDGRTKRKWFSIHAIKGIKSPIEFITSVKGCEQALNVDVYWPDVIASLAKLDADFSQKVERLSDY